MNNFINNSEKITIRLKDIKTFEKKQNDNGGIYVEMTTYDGTKHNTVSFGRNYRNKTSMQIINELSFN